MKAILMSIQPKWVEKILNGEKTIEIRKTMPKCELPIDVYVYETLGSYKKTVEFARGQGNDIKQSIYHFPNGCKKYFKDGVWYYDQIIKGNGKVVAKFRLEKVDKFGSKELKYYDDLMNILNADITYEEFFKYKGEKPVYFYHISNLEIFDKPKELGEFYVKKGAKICRGCPYFCYDYHEYGSGEYYCDYGGDEGSDYCPIINAPQSWQYIEVKE